MCRVILIIQCSIILLVPFVSCSNIETDELEDVTSLDSLLNSKKGYPFISGSIDKEQIFYSDSINFTISGISLWMAQVKGDKSNQGADCYGKYLFQFRADHSSIDILDMQEREFVSSIQLMSLGSDYHCNNVDFSGIFYDGRDPFPLLYSSHQGQSARCILVDRIISDGYRFELETVQRITIPSDVDAPLRFTPDAIVDKDNNCIYVYTGNTIPITAFYIYKFRLPSLNEGEIVTLGRSDILGSWVICDIPANYKQGGMIKDGIMYFMEGVPFWNTDNILRIVDLNAGVYKLVNLTTAFDAVWEPEDIFIYDNVFYIASNRAGIFRVECNFFYH